MTPANNKRTAKNIIAFHTGVDMAEMEGMAYQPGKYSNPAIYAIDDKFFCCPRKGARKRLHDGFTWALVAVVYGREIYVSEIAPQTITTALTYEELMAELHKAELAGDWLEAGQIKTVIREKHQNERYLAEVTGAAKAGADE